MRDHAKRRPQTRLQAVAAILLAIFFSIIAGFHPRELFALTAKAETSGNGFSVHFIDVGQADAALVLCDGKSMLIDGGNSDDSSLIYSYLKKMDIQKLDYVVCTHAHEDHVGGLSGALNFAAAGTILSPVTEYDSKAFNSFLKYAAKQNLTITIPKAGDTFRLGSADVKILGPIGTSDNPNNTSIILRIQYGETSFLFTGDAEREEEQDILNSGCELSSTVLKVGHHGSETSTTYPFLREIMPEYAVISVGKDNSYGHPSDDTLSRLRDAGTNVYRTDLLGNILCTSDGKTVSFQTEKNAGQYILNTNTKKFHYPSCSSVDQMKDKNKKAFNGTREEAVKAGYSPCGRCKP